MCAISEECQNNCKGEDETWEKHETINNLAWVAID